MSGNLQNNIFQAAFGHIMCAFFISVVGSFSVFFYRSEDNFLCRFSDGKHQIRFYIFRQVKKRFHLAAFEISDHASAQTFFRSAQKDGLGCDSHIPLEGCGAGADFQILADYDESGRVTSWMGQMQFRKSCSPFCDGDDFLDLFFVTGEIVLQRLHIDAGCRVSGEIYKFSQFFPADFAALIITAVTSVSQD